MVRRSYDDITKCFICKVNQARRAQDKDEFRQSEGAGSSSKQKTDETCLYCAPRLEKYTTKVKQKVVHAMRSGYTQVHRAFNMPHTAPGIAIAAVLVKPPSPPLPFDHDSRGVIGAGTEQEGASQTEVDVALAMGAYRADVDDHLSTIRQTLCLAGYTYEFEAVQNILLDCQADLALGHATLMRLRCDVAIAHAELSPSRQQVLVRQFGLRMFSGSRPESLDLLGLIAKHGWGEVTRFGIDDWNEVRGIVRKGRDTLRGWKHDIGLHRRAIRKAKQMEAQSMRMRAVIKSGKNSVRGARGGATGRRGIRVREGPRAQDAAFARATGPVAGTGETRPKVMGELDFRCGRSPVRPGRQGDLRSFGDRAAHLDRQKVPPSWPRQRRSGAARLDLFPGRTGLPPDDRPLAPNKHKRLEQVRRE